MLLQLVCHELYGPHDGGAFWDTALKLVDLASPCASPDLGASTGPQEEKEEGRGSDANDQGCTSGRFLQILQATGHTGGLRPAKGAQRHRETCLVVPGPARPASNVCAYAT